MNGNARGRRWERNEQGDVDGNKSGQPRYCSREANRKLVGAVQGSEVTASPHNPSSRIATQDAKQAHASKRACDSPSVCTRRRPRGCSSGRR